MGRRFLLPFYLTPFKNYVIIIYVRKEKAQAYLERFEEKVIE